MDRFNVTGNFKGKDEFARDFERIMKEYEKEGYTLELGSDAAYQESIQRFNAEFEFSPVMKEEMNKLCERYSCRLGYCHLEWLIPQDNVDVDELNNLYVDFDIRGNDDNSIASYVFIPSEADQIHLKEQIEENIQQLHMLSVKEYLTEHDDPDYIRLWGPGWITMKASNTKYEMKVLLEDYGTYTGSRGQLTIPYGVVFSGVNLIEAMVSGDGDLQEAKDRFNREFSDAWPERAAELGLNDN